MKTIHCSLSIRGALMNWQPRQWDGVFRCPRTGRELMAREAKVRLIDMLAQGVEKIPMGGPCEGFDPKEGCPGHEQVAP